MTVRLPEHDHCKFCGDPVPFDQAYCTEECYHKDQARIKKEKRDNIIFAVLTAASITVILILGYFLGSI